ncbi:hypothetical protein Tco_0611201 [Tanacetum coccineum]
MKAMQDQIQELLLCQTHGEDSNSHGSVNKGGSSGWHSNDIKVDIPEYDGKLDPDEFVEWIGTVERRERMRKEKIRTWPKMKAKMKQEFLPPHHIQATSECPNKRLVTLADFEIAGGYDFGVETCDDQVRTIDLDEEVVGPDVGELLEVVPMSPPKPWSPSWVYSLSLIYRHMSSIDRTKAKIKFGVMLFLWMLVMFYWVLTPIDPTTTPPKFTLSLSTLLKYEQHEYHFAKEFILLGLDEEDNKPHPNTDPLVQSLLKSYSHVFPTEIPPGSPPTRSIQHKIDLILGSALPNKPAYCTNPQETTEIRKQVDGLLEKGLIR